MAGIAILKLAPGNISPLTAPQLNNLYQRAIFQTLASLGFQVKKKVNIPR